MTATRQDAHRKHILVPGDYRFVAYLDLDIAGMVRDAHLNALEVNVALARHIAAQRARMDAIRARMVGDNDSLSQCNVCGAHIRYAVVFEHIPSGGLISTGEDCASGIDAAVMAGLANEAGAARKFAVTLGEAVKAAAARSAWLADDPDNAAAAEYVAANLSNDFCASLHSSLTRYGSMTDRQVAAALKAKARDAQRAQDAAVRASKGPGKHLGTIGQPLTVTVTVGLVKGIQTRFGWTTLVIMETADGDTVKTFAAGKFGDDVEKGQTLTVTGTVKSHDEYNGTLATMLTRCKVA